MKYFANKKNTSTSRHHRGIVLMFTLIVLVFISSSVGAYLSFVLHASRSTYAQINDCQALYLADAGIHYSIYNLDQDSGWAGTGIDVAKGQGTFSVSVTALGGGEYRILSTGTVDGQSRILQQDLTSSLQPKSNTWQEIGL